MKHPLLLLLIVAIGFVSCSRDRMIEITHTDNTKDTLMVNTTRFQIKDGTLKSLRGVADGGNFIIATNVKYYRIIQ